MKAVCKVQTIWRSYNQRKEAFKNCLMILWDKYYIKVFEDMGGQNKFTDTPRQQQNHTPILITALVRQSTLKKLKSTGNAQAIEMKEDQVAKNKFINMWFENCVRRYRRNYEVHFKELSSLTEIVKKVL